LGDPLPDGALARLGTKRLQHEHTTQLIGAAFSPDGKTIASLSWPGDDLRLWATATGKQLHKHAITSTRGCRPRPLAFSPDGTILAVGSASDEMKLPAVLANHIVLWDTATGNVLRRLRGDFDVLDLVFLDHGKTLLSAEADGTIRWWDVSTGNVQRTSEPFAAQLDPQQFGNLSQQGFAVAAFAPDGRALAVQPSSKRGWPLQYGEQAVVIDLVSGKPRWQTKSSHGTDMLFAFSPDGKRLAMQLGSGHVQLRDAVSGKELAVAPLPADHLDWQWIGGLVFSPDGSTVAIAGAGLNVGLWRLDDTAKLRTVSARLAGPSRQCIHCLTFSPDSKQLLMGVNNDVQLLQVATGMESLAWPGHRSAVDHVAFSADSQRLVTGGAQDLLHPNEVVTWDVKTWKPTQRSTLVVGKFAHLRTATGGHSIGIGKHGDDFYTLYDMTTGKPLRPLVDVDQNHLRHLAFFSPGGQFFFLWNHIQGKLVAEVFSTSTGKLLGQLPWKGREEVWAFSADDQLVALFAPGGLIHVHETATGKLLKQLDSSPDPRPQRLGAYFARPALAFSADGKALASWSRANEDVQVWDITTGKERYRLPVPASSAKYQAIGCLVWSPDGRMVAGCGIAGNLKILLWEVTSRKVRAELVGHEAEVRCLAFSPNGQWLASGSADATVLIWKV
jgi:WD40 repeat protein